VGLTKLEPIELRVRERLWSTVKFRSVPSSRGRAKRLKAGDNSCSIVDIHNWLCVNLPMNCRIKLRFCRDRGNCSCMPSMRNDKVGRGGSSRQIWPISMPLTRACFLREISGINSFCCVFRLRLSICLLTLGPLIPIPALWASLFYFRRSPTNVRVYTLYYNYEVKKIRVYFYVYICTSQNWIGYPGWGWELEAKWGMGDTWSRDLHLVEFEIENMYTKPTYSAHFALSSVGLASA